MATHPTCNKAYRTVYRAVSIKCLRPQRSQWK